ncbi:MAG: carboxypeptidase regulatory-like domain-containing protein [Cyclobacteriaceae bacterium]
MNKHKKLLILELILLLIVLITFQANSNELPLPTSLKVTVLDELGNPLEGATVKLYKTKEDYFNSENEVTTGTTNKKGIVTLKKLEPVSYYIDARIDDKSNDGMGAQTSVLQEGRINAVNTVIE